jgi:PAS domain S-box-containing protein
MFINDSGSLKRLHEGNVTRIREYYLMGALSVIFIIIINFFIAYHLTTEQDNMAHIINMSGRQRMLSQSIALNSHLAIDYLRKNNKSNLDISTTSLTTFIKEMESNNKSLVTGKINNLQFAVSDKVYQMYYSQPFDIDFKLNEYLEAAKFIASLSINASNKERVEASDKSDLIIRSSSELLSSLDAVVTQYAFEYSELHTIYKVIQIGLSTSLIVAIILEIIIIFLPLEKRIRNRESLLIKEINERNLAEDKLKRTEYIYKLLESNIPNMAFLLFDTDYRYILAGGPFLATSGYKKSDVEGKCLDEVIKDKGRVKELKELYALALSGKTSYLKGVSSSGAYYETTIVPMRDTLGNINGGMAVTEDVSLQTNSRKEHLEIENRFRQLVDNIESAFWLASSDGSETIYLSPKFEKIFGRSIKSLYNKPKSFIDSIHPDDLDIVQKNRIQRIHDNNYDVEYRVVDDQKNIRWLWSRAFAVKDQTGTVVRTAGIIEDISKRKELEGKAFQLEIERQTVKILSDFIRDTAHDLRTPLTIIGTSAYLIKKLAQNDEQSHYIDTINKQVGKLTELIGQLHSMSQIEMMSSIYNKEIDVNYMIKSILANTRYKAMAKNIEVLCDLSEENIVIIGDENYLYKAISNMCDNAVLYTSVGQVEIKTTVIEKECTITISDTGIGIDEKEIDKIFDRFYKINKARPLNESGSGLGLSMSKLIIEKHGGKVTVNSTIGVGSTFTICLPLSKT